MLHVRLHHHHCSHQTFHQSPPPPNWPALIRFLLSDFPSDVVQIALSGPSLSFLSLSPTSFQRTTVGFRDVQCRPDQVPLSHSFFFEIQISDEILSAAAIADVCRLRGRSIRRTKFSAGAGKQGGSRREQERQLQLRAQDVRK